ncbi:uncharacterized protein LOC108599035 [Drosophila busckii]|nr:uncharacterized protein LOC108599035 [Drosophila busckii]
MATVVSAIFLAPHTHPYTKSCKMSKLQIMLFGIVLCLLALSEAQSQNQRQRYQQQRLFRTRSRTFARQEVAPADAEAAVTPYPSADELKPEVPFDEAAAAEPTPDAVYGPPEFMPDEVYGPPDAAGNDLPAAADVPTEQARLVAARRAANYRRAQLQANRRPAKLSAVRRA